MPRLGPHGGGRAITNLLAAPIELSRVKLSANWMAACGEPGEDAALYATVRPWAWSCARSWASDSGGQRTALSMRTQWRMRTRKVVSPVSLIVSAASLRRARHARPSSTARGRRHHAGAGRPGPGQTAWAAASWGQVLGQSGDASPTWTMRRTWSNLVKAINALRAKAMILAYHDRSDGGLLAAVAEMAFAGQWAWR